MMCQLILQILVFVAIFSESLACVSFNFNTSTNSLFSKYLFCFSERIHFEVQLHQRLCERNTYHKDIR